jgi:outer membrane protein OmpA-like peptidoglycan-associated protein
MKKSNGIPLLLLTLLFFASASLFQNTLLQAQNLVPNPGFEEHHYDSVLFWQQPGGTFYHFENNSKWAHSGNCINGLCEWTIGPTEYLEVKLTSPLIKEKKYRVTAYTMIKPEDQNYILADKIRSMGILFNKNPIDVHPKIYIIHEPDIILYVYKDTLWHKSESEYIASGGENYLLIGHFFCTNDVHDHKIDTNYQNYLTEIDILSLEKPKVIKTEIDKIYEKYKQIQEGAWNINNEKNPRKQEKLIRNFNKKMMGQKKEINDKIVELNDEFDTKLKALERKYKIDWRFYSGNHKYRLYFDDISVEPAPEPLPVQEQIIILNNVFFNTAEWILLPTSFVELNKQIAYLKEKSNLKVEISGHTDIIGNDTDNKLLSENRARAVVDYFIQNGISPDRLSYKGYGSSKPIANNQTEEGRAKNRRVEMKIISE